LELFQNRSAPKKNQYREVFLDESYIHEHYHRLEESIWDPNDDQDLQCKLPHKGQRYCFIAAIQGPHPQNMKKDPAGMVPGSLWYFCPNKKAQKGDYHKAFNGSNFLEWWHTHLLPNLTSKSIIIMDNAKYHLTLSDKVPKPNKMKKRVL